MRSNPLVPVAAAVLFLALAPVVHAAGPVAPLRASLPVRAESAPSPVAVERPAAKTEEPVGRGGVFLIGGGVSYLGGAVVKGFSASAMETSFSIRGGYYVTRHVGIIGGLEFGFGQVTDGCVDGRGNPSDECGSASARVPVVVELSLMDRKHGPYFQSGLAFGSVHAMTGTTDSVIAVTPAELSLGVGARMPIKTADKSTTRTIDLHIRTDIGQATYVSAAMEGASRSGMVLADRRATHVNASFVLALGF